MLVSAQSCARFDNFLVDEFVSKPIYIIWIVPNKARALSLSLFLVDEFVSNPINMIWITPKKATLSLSLSRFLVDEFVSKPIYSFKTILCSL
jgi:hypothetical protein